MVIESVKTWLWILNQKIQFFNLHYFSLEEGSYYLNVNEEEPFAMDVEGVNC